MGIRYAFIALAILCIFGGVAFALYGVLNQGVGDEPGPVDTAPAEPSPSVNGSEGGVVVGTVGTLPVRARDGGTVAIRDITNDPTAGFYIPGEPPYYYSIESQRYPGAYRFAYAPEDHFFNLIILDPLAMDIRDAEQEFQSYFEISEAEYCRLDVKRVRYLGDGKIEDVTSQVCVAGSQP